MAVEYKAVARRGVPRNILWSIEQVLRDKLVLVTSIEHKTRSVCRVIFPTESQPPNSATLFCEPGLIDALLPRTTGHRAEVNVKLQFVSKLKASWYHSDARWGIFIGVIGLVAAALAIVTVWVPTAWWWWPFITSGVAFVGGVLAFVQGSFRALP